MGSIDSANTTKPPSSGYPLETPPLYWQMAAVGAYTITGLTAFKPEILPTAYMAFIHAIFKDQNTIIKFGIGAAAIHVGYAVYVSLAAQRRKYDAKATAWWAFMSFAFGFLGVKMFLDKE